jgi:hypothetical protein
VRDLIPQLRLRRTRLDIEHTFEHATDTSAAL